MSKAHFELDQLYSRLRSPKGKSSEDTLVSSEVNRTLDAITVMIVDDLPETRNNLQKLLQFESDIYVIAQAENGHQAIVMAHKYMPDVILMDVNMPGIDGILACWQITQTMQTPHVIMMSVQSEPNYLLRAMRAGASDYLTKPVSGVEIETAIRRAYRLPPRYAVSTEIKPDDSKLATEANNLKLAKLQEQVELFSTNILDGHLVDELAHLVGGIAHDLRSPINLILGILNSVESVSTTSPIVRKYLERISRRVLFCQWIIDNFLGISFNEKLIHEDVTLYDSVQQVLSILKDRYPPSVYLHIDIPKTLVAQIDSKHFSLIVANLISNAYEAMPNGGTAVLTSKVDKTNIQIVITDNGNGIPLESTQYLFRIGFTTKPGQCGLGLYVARRLISQLSGDLVFLNSEEGLGSQFALSFPIKANILPNSVELKDLEQQIHELSMQIERYKAQTLSVKDKNDIRQEFKRITTTFAYSLHNELAIIHITLSEVLTQTDDKHIQQILKKIARNNAYAQLLVRNMMELGEIITPKWSLVSLVSLIEEVLELLERKMPPEMYRVEWDIDLTLGHIQADETQMKQVFMNLTRNALDAMPEGGTLKFEIRSTEDNVVVHVSDSGIGVSAENLSRLFTLGFTTKPEGYGIGLFSIKTIIDKHNGSIKAVSTLGKGTTFTVKLPQRQKG